MRLIWCQVNWSKFLVTNKRRERQLYPPTLRHRMHFVRSFKILSTHKTWYCPIVHARICQIWHFRLELWTWLAERRVIFLDVCWICAVFQYLMKEKKVKWHFPPNDYVVRAWLSLTHWYRYGQQRKELHWIQRHRYPSCSNHLQQSMYVKVQLNRYIILTKLSIWIQF